MRKTNADRAMELYLWLKSEGLRRKYTGAFLATKIGMTHGKNFQSVTHLVNVLANSEGLGLCYPVHENGMRYSLSNDATELDQNLYHLRRTRQGVQAVEVRYAQSVLANHPGDVDRFAAETTLQEARATELVYKRRLRQLAARWSSGGPRI
jgi:hypothetical protein